MFNATVFQLLIKPILTLFCNMLVKMVYRAGKQEEVNVKITVGLITDT